MSFPPTTRSTRHSAEVPPFARMILSRMALWRQRNMISQAKFLSQLQRVQREELNPKGLAVEMKRSSPRIRLILTSQSSNSLVEEIVVE